jgi:hypothetical protein
MLRIILLVVITLLFKQQLLFYMLLKLESMKIEQQELHNPDKG